MVDASGRGRDVPGGPETDPSWTDRFQNRGHPVPGYVGRGDGPVCHRAKPWLDAMETLVQRRLADEVNPRGSRVEPARGILAAAAGGSLPLVVMGTHGRGSVARTLMGGVAREVAGKMEAPLLLVPG